jgi:hypothetical protein
MANIMSITSIIPNMIFGIVLIIAWLPAIILTENNNKGNRDEYKLLEDKIKTDLKLSDVTLTFDNISVNNFKYYNNDITDLINTYKNLYVTGIETIKTIKRDANNKQITTLNTNKLNDSIYNKVLINGAKITDEDYIYLAKQNKLNSETIINDNITYEFTYYYIPTDKQIMKVEGLQQYAEELDMDIYNYEFGSEEEAIKSIKNRKLSSNTLFKWLGRIGTFVMLLVGLSLLISPLTYLNQLGDALPGPFKILAIPGKIIASLYNSLSFVGSLLLTLLMTFFVWSIINYPLISVVIGGLIVGLLLYFNKK